MNYEEIIVDVLVDNKRGTESMLLMVLPEINMMITVTLVSMIFKN